jgi:Leucine-rich repeat (LRR) protein
LDLHANKLTSLTGIHLPTLQKLYVASNKLNNCDGIQGLQQLTTLHMRENSITSLNGFVPSLGALQYLNFRANSLEDVAELGNLRCLPLLRALVLAGQFVSW